LKYFKTQDVDGETLYLNYYKGTWKLTIDPPNRYNGTHKYDGWFPRFYSNPSHAKAAVTRKFGNEWQWQEL